MTKGNNILNKSNDLIKGSFEVENKELSVLTGNEYKLFNKILLQCQLNFNKDSSSLSGKFTLEEAREIFKNKNISTPKAIADTLKKFLGIKIKYKTGNRIVFTNILTAFDVDENTYEFTCFIHRELFEALTGYKEVGYSPINLTLMNKAKGYYTQRLYELLRVWSGTKKVIGYDIDYLKEFFEVDKMKCYESNFNFKNRVIIPAIKEINEKMEMKVDFKEIKASRKIIKIEFIVNDLQGREYEFKKGEFIEPKPKKTFDNIKKQKSKNLTFNNFKGREYTEEDYRHFEEDLKPRVDNIPTNELNVLREDERGNKNVPKGFMTCKDGSVKLIIVNADNIRNARLQCLNVNDNGILLD